jgi:hypothetical protein
VWSREECGVRREAVEERCEESVEERSDVRRVRSIVQKRRVVGVGRVPQEHVHTFVNEGGHLGALDFKFPIGEQ